MANNPNVIKLPNRKARKIIDYRALRGTHGRSLAAISAVADFDPEHHAMKLEQIRCVISIACHALKLQDCGDDDEIRMVLVRHADDALHDLIKPLRVKP